MVVAVIVHIPDGAVGLVQRVESLHDIAVPRLVLRLVVTSVRVRHLVLELVLRVRLRQNTQSGLA